MKPRWTWFPDGTTIKAFNIASGNIELTICEKQTEHNWPDFWVGEDVIPSLSKLHGRECCYYSPLSVFSYMTVHGRRKYVLALTLPVCNVTGEN